MKMNRGYIAAKLYHTNFRLVLALAVLIMPGSLLAQGSWQTVNMPAINSIAANLKNPPSQNSITVTWGWDGNITREVIARDLDKFFSLGFRAVTIEPGYGMAGKYLSEAWFQSIKMATEEAKKRGMHIWIIDEGKYPSGFAGGKISQERPDLKMQALTVAEKIHATEGQTIDRTLPAEVISAIAINSADKSSQAINISGGKLHWVAPTGNWDITVVQRQFRTSPTRSANNPSKGKDGSASLMDYLNPAATKQFLTWTEEEYKKYIGDEFGKTILGFRGDEPAFSYTPWTTEMPNIFKAKKGYDIVPYLASFFAQNPNTEQQKAKADFYDVWSDLFGENYFKMEGDWCKKNGMEYIVHLDKDDNMGQFIRSGGDFFKDMRGLQIPGVDAIWHQIWSDTVANFPKFASSVSHVYNKPRAFSETFAAYRPAPNDEQAKWVLNEQLVRGINIFELMFVPSSANSGETRLRGYMGETAFPELVKYTNRACYLLTQGRPAAQVAFYLPTTSLWMGDTKSNVSSIHIGEQLLNTQRDFDFVDEQALASDLKLAKGQFTTAGGTAYNTVVFPAISVISQAVLNRLKDFALQGGHVIFIGNTPALATAQNFLNGKSLSAVDFSWATFEPLGELSEMAISKMGKSDVILGSPNPTIKYIHRVTKDADIYFFFNESMTVETNTTAQLKGEGFVQSWDVSSDTILPETPVSTKANGLTPITLKLKPQETRFFILSKTRVKL